VTEFAHHAGRLRGRDDVDGQKHPELRMAPAQQRLDRQRPVAHQVHDRLVDQAELTTAQGTGQLTLDRVLAPHRLRDGAVVPLHMAGPELPGTAQRELCAVKYVGARRSGGQAGEARADPDLHRPAPDRHRTAQHIDQPVGEGIGVQHAPAGEHGEAAVAPPPGEQGSVGLRAG